jgi:hypothetical protein
MACVDFDPVGGAFVGCTPLPDATSWKLELPGGISLEPDGKIGMFRATVRPRENRVAIEHALRPGESTAGMAGSLRITGLRGVALLLNGQPATLNAEGQGALRSN